MRVQQGVGVDGGGGVGGVREGVRMEREFKIAIQSEQDLLAVEGLLGKRPGAVLRQRNFYLDADRALNAQHYALRLRLENAKAELEIKGPRIEKSGAMLGRPESEPVKVSNVEYAGILNGTIDPMPLLAERMPPGEPLLAALERVLGGKRPTVFGEISNERREYVANVEGLPVTIEVDRTDYGKFGRAFELEVEVNDADAARTEAVRRFLDVLLARAGVKGSEAPGKLARLRAFQAGGGPAQAQQ